MSEKDFTIMHSRNMQQVSVTQRITKVLTLFIELAARRRRAVRRAITYVLLALWAVIVLFPFYWMIISSLKSLDEYRASVPTFWPRMVLISNYADAFSTGNLGRLFLNTAYVGIVSTMLSLIITILTAFAFARLEFKGKNALFGALLATMMIPGELFTITNYQTIFMLGWQNTYTVLIVPFLVSVFYIYLLRQNFLQIPNELYLAAKVDGTSDFKYLWKVMLPICRPTVVTIVILKVIVYNVFEYEYGLINSMLVNAGLNRIDFYNSPKYWPGFILAFYLWKNLGYGMVVYLATIMGISDEYYDAAKVDGANIFQQIWYITVPLLKPTFIILLLYALGGIMKGQFELFYQTVGNNGVLYDVTDILDTYVYRVTTTQPLSMGLSAAAGLYQSVFGLVIVILTNWFIKRSNAEYALF